MADRYFLETPPIDERAVVAGPEAHHLIHVMRCRPGDDVVLFDGSGAEFAAQVQSVGRTEVQCRIVARQQIDRELSRSVVLAVALPKGDRQRWLVEKCVELGVATLVPLETERGVAQPVDNALVRLRRAVIEAAKQCGRNRLMEIAAPVRWADFVQTQAPEAARFLAHPSGASIAKALSTSETTSTARSLVFAVGPEGGFAAAEVKLAMVHGWQTLDLGTRILRVETAALALAAIAMLHDWPLECGDSSPN